MASKGAAVPAARDPNPAATRGAAQVLAPIAAVEPAAPARDSTRTIREAGPAAARGAAAAPPAPTPLLPAGERGRQSAARKGRGRRFLRLGLATAGLAASLALAWQVGGISGWDFPDWDSYAGSGGEPREDPPAVAQADKLSDPLPAVAVPAVATGGIRDLAATKMPPVGTAKMPPVGKGLAAPEVAPKAVGEPDRARPRIDLVRLEPDGAAVVVGVAAPFGELLVLDNGRAIGSVTANALGEWVLVSTLPQAEGDHEFSLAVKSKLGGIVVPESVPDAGETPSRDAPGREAKSGDTEPLFPRQPLQDPSPTAESGAVESQAAREAAPVIEPVIPRRKPPVPRISGARASSADAFVIQLSSLKSAALAQQEWLRLQRSYPDLLGDKNLDLEQASLGGSGTVYRIRAGPFTERRPARRICALLKARKQDCLVVRHRRAI